jgi:hypothetical protein|tara:strand:- start:142 stop:396 length:255 start_codon:yes stop_codon:yes gene_type:complete
MNPVLKQFIDYVFSFYGCPDDVLYPLVKDNRMVTKGEIYQACKVYNDRLMKASAGSFYTWGDGDSLDRERVRDILINDFDFVMN